MLKRKNELDSISSWEYLEYYNGWLPLAKLLPSGNGLVKKNKQSL